jgi:hypothetical protein
MAGGKAARGEAVRSSHAVVGSGRGRPDLIKLLLEQEESWVTERPDPLRADAGLVRHVLLGCRADPDRRPSSSHPMIGDHRATVRLCAPVQLRLVRFARASAHVRNQRFRRDAARPWEWFVKRAARREFRGRRPDLGFSPLDRRAIVQADAGAPGTDARSCEDPHRNTDAQDRSLWRS